MSTEEKTVTTDDLNSAIAEAQKENEATAAKEEEDKTATTATEVEDEEAEASEESSEEEVAKLTDAEAENAKNLFLALKDPTQRRIVLEAMVRQEGLEIGAGKKEEQAAEESVESILQNALGQQFPFLSKQLGPAIRKAIEVETAKINKTLAKNQETVERKEAAAAWDKLGEEFPEMKKLEGDMEALMDEIQPGKSSTNYKYFKTLLITAAANKGVSLTKSGKAKVNSKQREAHNRNDAGSRTASEGSQESVVLKDQDMSLDDAVKSAFAELGAAEG